MSIHCEMVALGGGSARIGHTAIPPSTTSICNMVAVLTVTTWAVPVYAEPGGDSEEPGYPFPSYQAPRPSFPDWYLQRGLTDVTIDGDLPVQRCYQGDCWFKDWAPVFASFQTTEDDFETTGRVYQPGGRVEIDARQFSPVPFFYWFIDSDIVVISGVIRYALRPYDVGTIFTPKFDAVDVAPLSARTYVIWLSGLQTDIATSLHSPIPDPGPIPTGPVAIPENVGSPGGTSEGGLNAFDYGPRPWYDSGEMDLTEAGATTDAGTIYTDANLVFTIGYSNSDDPVPIDWTGDVETITGIIQQGIGPPVLRSAIADGLLDYADGDPEGTAGFIQPIGAEHPYPRQRIGPADQPVIFRVLFGFAGGSRDTGSIDLGSAQDADSGVGPGNAKYYPASASISFDGSDSGMQCCPRGIHISREAAFQRNALDF